MSVDEVVQALRTREQAGRFSLEAHQLAKAPRTSLVTLTSRIALGVERPELTIFLTDGQEATRVLVSDRYVFESVRLEDLLDFVDVVTSGKASFRKLRYLGLIAVVEMKVDVTRTYLQRRRLSAGPLMTWEEA